MQYKIDLKLTEGQRRVIEERMSSAMGRHIESTGVTDFAQWTPEQWQDLVAVAFDIAATETFRSRIAIVGPLDVEESDVPF
jgi:hypothetical protein